MTLEEARAEFVLAKRGMLALPITGAIVYAVAGALALVIAPEWRNAALALCFWAIPPLGALISKLRGEALGDPAANPLFKLSAYARIMALSTWAVHVPVWIVAPQLFPLTVGILFALHWVVFSWSIGHPVGFYHLASRIVLSTAAWTLFPGNRVSAVCFAVSAAYLGAIVALRRIDWHTRLGLAQDPFAQR